MKKIYKYPLSFSAIQIISMPKDAEILCVQMQGEFPAIWTMIDPENACEEKMFGMFGTGHEVPFDMGISRNYIGTIQHKEFVFHIFEIIN